MLDTVAGYNRTQFQGKIKIQTQENGEKPHFVLDLGPLDPNLGHHFFFFKNQASSVSRYHGQLLLCTISEKTNDSIFRKFSDGRTDGQTDRQTDWSVRLTSSAQ